MSAPPTKQGTCEKCGQKIPHPRNQARHNLFFAVLVPAFKHWPESHEFQPEDTEHLRGWLLAKAGHCTFKEIDIGDAVPEAMLPIMTAFVNSTHRIAGAKSRFLKATKKGLRAYEPKSIAYDKCDEDTFKKILDLSIEIIETTIGVKIEKLKAETAREA